MQTPRRGVIREIGDHTTAFAVVFFVMFALMFVFLAATDALPNAISTDNSDTTSADTSATTNSANTTAPALATPTGQGALPTRVVSSKIGLDVTVANPTSTDVDVLDTYLLKGAVRYPTSGQLGTDGTVLLFGHSSYLPIVHNQNYKAFDGIQNLKAGDTVSVYSGQTEYRYTVKEVHLASATADVIELPTVGQHLTLVTCDSFGSKTDRFVMTADLQGVYNGSN
jgi:LPXTG-site transpeptidase (sortase) family protein